MNKITLNNYEAYLLDFSEGQLSEEMQMELELFLLQHPKLEINLSELSLVTIEEDAVSFSGKEKLKKQTSDLVTEEQFIAYIESQLPQQERANIELSCFNNKDLANELKLFQAAIAEPDSEIQFPFKESLKRQPKIVWFNWSVTNYSIAASVVLLLGLFFMWPKTQTGISAEEVAHQNKLPRMKAPQTTTAPILLAKAETTKQTIKPTTGIKQHRTNRDEQNTTEQNVASNTNTVQINKDEITSMPTPVLNVTQIATNNNQTNNTTKLKTTVEVITENDDELIASNTNKKGIWAFAQRALKNLNSVGVKSVDGEEANNNKYALTLGSVSITHNSH